MLILRFDVAADDIGPRVSAAPARAAWVRKSRRLLVLEPVGCSFVFMTSPFRLGALCIPTTGDGLGVVGGANVDTHTEKKNALILNTL
jgi:hypothetical protein